MLFGEKYRQTKKTVVFYVAVTALFIIIGILTPGGTGSLGIMSLIPAVFLIVYIFLTKRIVEGLILSTLLCTVMSDKLEFFRAFNEIIFETMLDSDVVWLIIVCGLMGSVIALVERSGGGLAFGRFMAGKVKNERQSLLCTAACSLLLSIDDYMNVLTTGSAMTEVNNQKQVPREMTAYVIASTAAPACALNPISTWAVFIGSLMVANGLGDAGGQITVYLRSIPYNFYAIFALAIEFLVVLGIIPKFGLMKKSYERVEGTTKGETKAKPASGEVPEETETSHNAGLRNFFVPMLVLIGATIVCGFDMQMGVIATLGFCFIWFVAQGMEPLVFVDEMLNGIKNMLLPLLLMILAFSFANGCSRIGFLDYVVDIAVRKVSLGLLPFVVFMTFSATEFIMGISWGMYIIALPLVLPITFQLGGNPFITTGAVAAAGVFGAHCCFYSDSAILTSAATGCDNIRHAVSQLPYGLIAGVLAGLGYLIAGMMM